MKKVKQRPQFIWGSLIGSIGNIASSVINNNARNKLVKEQMSEQARQNAINNNQLAVNNLNNYYASQNNLDNAYKSTFEDQIVYRNGGKVRPKAGWGMLATLGSLAGTAIDGFASQGFGYNKLQGGNYTNNVNTNPNIKYSVNPASTGINLVYRRGGIATQHPRRRSLTDAQYYSIMKQVAIDNWRKWGDASPAAAFNRAINSNAYDYRGYYNKYPNSRANADTHWTDEFKGVGEKTFSDQSKYSGVRHPKYNPNGIRGGHWYGANEDMFVPSIQQLVERSKFARGGKYNFANFANRLERNVNESDNTRVASGRRVVNARNRQYRRDNSIIGKVINYIDKSDRASQIKRKGTLTAQQYRNSKAAQTFGRYDRVNYNGKTYYVPQVQGGIAPGVSIRNPAQILQGVQTASKIRQAANASKIRQAANASKAEGSNIMKYVQQRANPNSIYNGRVNTVRMRSPFGQLRNRLANRNQLNALEEKAMAERYRKDPSKFIQDLVGGDIKTEAAIRRSQMARRAANRAAKLAREETTDARQIAATKAKRAAEAKLFNQPYGNQSNGTVNGGRIQLRQPATQSASTAQPTVSVTPATTATQAKPINTSNILNLAHTDAITRWGITHPKSAIASIIGIPTAIEAAAGFINRGYNRNQDNKNIAASKTVNKPKAKVQPKQVKNDTAQVAKQTPNDSTVVENNNQTPVTNNKTSNQVSPSSTQISNNKKAAETIQRRGRTKSRVSANRTNNNSNNFRQNINFEPIDDTVNGYSQVEDIQGRSYDEYKADVDAEAEARRQEVINDLLTNYNYKDRNTTDEMRYGGKTRSKRRVPIKITDGGVAQKIGNNTFLLRGGSHEQVNPSGQTGIGIKVGNNEIEAEGGEVAQRVGNALRIFSAQPMINGVSPAQAVEAGANKNRIFAIQEALKRKGYKCGGSVKFARGGKVNPIFKYNDYAGIEDLPNSNTGISSGTYNNGNLSLGQAEKTIFPKGFVSHDSSNIGSRKTDTAPIDNWWNRNGMSVNSSDWIGLGTDLAGSLALGAFNTSAYKNLKYDYKLPNYVDETPVAFDTTYHNDAQRATVERNRLNAQKIIANNTSSANTAVQRMQQSNADAMMETNKLWDEKANKEVELRNMAAQNEQQVRARNAAARNQYYQNVAEIQNKRIDAENANRLARSNAWSTSLQGLQGAANNFLNSTRQRFEDENALMATIAAGDAATPYRMMAFGTQFGPRVINAIRAMNNVESMKDPGAAPVRSNYSNDADYSTARSKWETAMRNYEYWKQRDRFLSNYDSRGRLIRRR